MFRLRFPSIHVWFLFIMFFSSFFLSYFYFRLGQQKLFISSMCVVCRNGSISLNVHFLLLTLRPIPPRSIIAVAFVWLLLSRPEKLWAGSCPFTWLALMMGKLSFEKHQRRLFSQDNSSALKSQVRPTSHGELKLNERDERRDGGKKLFFAVLYWLVFTYTFYTFVCYLITRRCCCLNKVIAVHAVRLISSE